MGQIGDVPSLPGEEDPLLMVKGTISPARPTCQTWGERSTGNISLNPGDEPTRQTLLLSQFFMNKKPKCRESSLPKATQGFELGSV